MRMQTEVLVKRYQQNMFAAALSACKDPQDAEGLDTPRIFAASLTLHVNLAYGDKLHCALSLSRFSGAFCP